jgi:hypothetical protein
VNERDRGTPAAPPARAIDRNLDDCLEDILAIGERALSRVWKGQPHPDYLSALKSRELEAKLRGWLRDGGDDRDLKKRSLEELQALGKRYGLTVQPIRKA